MFTHRFDADSTRISFPAKPSEAIRALLKGAGFRWPPSGGFWWRRGCKGAADFIAALDRKLNPGRPDGACWRCQSPQGFFRPRGPSTPVYCDACDTMLQENLAKVERGEPLSRVTVKQHTCAGMHDVSCDACHEALSAPPAPDRFDMDYEDNCRAACGL